jgi:hypothetical protein
MKVHPAAFAFCSQYIEIICVPCLVLIELISYHGAFFLLGIDRGTIQKMACALSNMDPIRTHLKESLNLNIYPSL